MIILYLEKFVNIEMLSTAKYIKYTKKRNFIIYLTIISDGK